MSLSIFQVTLSLINFSDLFHFSQFVWFFLINISNVPRSPWAAFCIIFFKYLVILLLLFYYWISASLVPNKKSFPQRNLIHFSKLFHLDCSCQWTSSKKKMIHWFKSLAQHKFGHFVAKLTFINVFFFFLYTFLALF